VLQTLLTTLLSFGEEKSLWQQSLSSSSSSSFLWSFQSAFFFHVIFRVSNGFFFVFSHSLGKKRISVLYEEAL